MALIQKKKQPQLEHSPLGPPDLKVQESIAETLRLARSEHGQDLRTVAQVLRIRHAYLEAIEAGDFEALPGTAYAIGFLRTYAEFLGLDGEAIVERFKREAQGEGPKLDLVFPEPVGHNRIPGGAIVLISVVLLGVAYGGWFYLSNEGKNIADLMPPLPESLQAMISGGDGGRGEGGQDTAMPETVPVASGDTLGASVAGADAPVYMPPESAEAESQTPIETVDPGITGDSDALAPAQLAIVDAAELAENAEPSQVDTAVLEAADPALAIPAQTPSPAPEIPAPEVPGAVESPTDEVVKKAETPAPEAAIEPTPEVAAPSLPSPIESDVSTAAADFMLPSPNHTTLASSVEPMLDETVVIPSPPTSTQEMALSGTRSPRVYGQNDTDTRIVLRAVEDSWVQVRDRQDALLLTRVLRSGDTYYVPDRSGLTLLTGNAGGIAIEVDGVALAPLGPVGAVRRQIALDPARLLDGTASPR